MSDTPVNDLDSLFEEEKSNKLVWILPSVILHVVVIAIWFVIPKEDPSKRERKLVIKSEQAEQLQEFVENANLEELRFEVQELQQIKAAMAKIREDRLKELEGFESSMAADAPKDAQSLFKNILEANQASLKAYNDMIGAHSAYIKELQSIQEAVKAKNISAVLPVMPKLKERYNALKQASNKTEGSAQTLQIQQSNGLSVLEWIKSDKVKPQWETLGKAFEAANATRLVMRKELLDPLNRQMRSVTEFVEKGKTWQKQLTDIKAKGEKAKAAVTAKRAEANKALDAAKKAMAEAKTQYGELSKKVKELSKNKKRTKEQTAELKKLQQETKKAQQLVRKYDGQRKSAEKLVRAVRDYKVSRDDSRIIRHVDNQFKGIAAIVGNAGTLSAAIESQTLALKATQDAMKVIMEAANAQAQQTQ